MKIDSDHREILLKTVDVLKSYAELLETMAVDHRTCVLVREKLRSRAASLRSEAIILTKLGGWSI